MKASHTIRPVFDDPNLVSAAGLVPAMLLAESAGLHDLLDLLPLGHRLQPVAREGDDVDVLELGHDEWWYASIPLPQSAT